MLSFLFIFLYHIFLNQAALLHCDFETYCNDFVRDRNWGLTNGRKPQGIDHDHTLNTSAGHYLYYNPLNDTRFNIAEITINNWTELTIDRPLCFRMWYYTPLLHFPFNIQLLQGDDKRLTRIATSIKGKDPSINDWTLINITLPNEKLKIAIRINVTNMPLAFDDMSVDYCDGPRPVPPKILFTCDFESSCSDNFVSLPSYPYQWSILNASDAIKIEASAPPVDYTFGNASGHYALLPVSSIIEKGKVGYLHLKKELQITSEETYCLNFQYYNYGKYFQSNLKVYLWTSDETKLVETVWPIQDYSVYIYTTGSWTWGVINLPVGNYTLLFRVDSAENSRTLFALDNIAITSCDYPSSEISPYNSLLSFSCNFDDLNMCGMINEDLPPRYNPTFNYTVYTGETVPNKDLGPTRDHTTNSTTGGFLYLDQQIPFTVKDYGSAKTPKTIEQNSGMCIKFAYYVKSTAINKNGTQLWINAGGCYGASVWSVSLDDSQGWQTVIAPVLNYACMETYRFVTNQVEPTYVSVAFDDIEIDQCSTLIPTTTTTMQPTTTTVKSTTTTSTSTITSTMTSTETSSESTITSTETTSISTVTLISTTTPVKPTPSNAHRLLSLNRYSLIIIYIFIQFFQKYFIF